MVIMSGFIAAPVSLLLTHAEPTLQSYQMPPAEAACHQTGMQAMEREAQRMMMEVHRTRASHHNRSTCDDNQPGLHDCAQGPGSTLRPQRTEQPTVELMAESRRARRAGARAYRACMSDT
ncbi:hypothetical protein [Maricaulis sp. CAU 1757]